MGSGEKITPSGFRKMKTLFDPLLEIHDNIDKAFDKKMLSGIEYRRLIDILYNKMEFVFELTLKDPICDHIHQRLNENSNT